VERLDAINEKIEKNIAKNPVRYIKIGQGIRGSPYYKLASHIDPGTDEPREYVKELYCRARSQLFTAPI
jgi:hypothetical protein